MAARTKKFLAKLFAHAIGEHCRDFEHAYTLYVYWIWVRGSACYVVKENSKFSKPVVSNQIITKSLYGNFEKSFLEWEKMTWRKIFRHFLHADFFMFILSNHTVFLVQFGINLPLWVFQKAENALAEAARAIWTFWKTHTCKLIPNWTRKIVWLPIPITDKHLMTGPKGNSKFCLPETLEHWGWGETILTVSRAASH